ncbi:MAG: hypothetical protein KDB61_01160, partial [Planctomycetes bacterium]|nr:hypothetical protein [Planctomycetota bacterium]
RLCQHVGTGAGHALARGQRGRLGRRAGQVGQVSINFALSGNIVPQYTALLKAHVKTPPKGDVIPFKVESRLFLSSPQRYEGVAIPTGFSSVIDVKEWRNERTQIGPGELVQLSVSARRQITRKPELDDRLEYLELEVPIPSGLEVFDTRRANERPYRIVGNSLVFPLGPMNRSRRTFEVGLVATHPGVYQAPRVLLRSVYHPELLATSDAGTIALLPEGAVSQDGYRATPDERFYLGKKLFEDKKFAEARASLLPLLDEFENDLRPSFLGDTARMLLFSSVDSAAPDEIVRYFEIVKQRDPDLFIPIAQVLKIGDAYSRMGEHERAMLIFRATLNETFGKDLQIVGVLDQQNHWLMATRLLDRLIGEYPDLPLAVETDLTLANRVLEMAPNAHLRSDLQKVGADRAALTAMGIQRLHRFLGIHAKSPLSSDAALNLVSALFDLEDHKSAAELCAEMVPLTTEPVFLDAFRYSGALSAWYLGQDDKALEELQSISNARYERPNQPAMDSPNRDLAKYIMAQIYHAQKNVEQASRYYQEIENLYRDAALALASMGSQELEIDEEVIRVHPGEQVKLRLTHRNLDRAELLVYPVDLMTLYLREKDLSRVTQVNLAGVSPKFRGTLDITDVGTLRKKSIDTSLPLTEPGAYLVLVRGGSIHASSLVLVSDLELDVEEFSDGGVRVQVSGFQEDAFLKDVDIRVLGSENGKFSIGKTDLRGLFSAEDVQGRATVIARKGDNHYAFHRGTQDLSPDRNKDKDLPALMANPGQEFFFSNVQGVNRGNVLDRNENLNEEIQMDRKGVQVQTVY